MLVPSTRATAAYRGPALLKSSLKRTSSSGSDSTSSSLGSSVSKRPKVDYSSGAIGARHTPVGGKAGFKVPFKAPGPAPVKAREREMTPVIEIDDDENEEPVVAKRFEGTESVPVFEPPSDSDEEELPSESLSLRLYILLLTDYTSYSWSSAPADNS